MKRTRESKANDAGLSSAGRGRPKRTKILACTLCRKHKTRCEILDGISTDAVRCHRCKVLNATCSYESMDKAIFMPEQRSSLSVDAATASRPADALLGTSAGSPPLNEPVHRTDFLWSFIPDQPPHLDWSLPMLAIHELCKRPEPAILPVFDDQSLENILSLSEIEQHLAIFNAKYAPWMNFTLIHEGATPFLDLVCCTISSRYLDVPTRSNVAPRLQKLTEDKIVCITSNPSMFESIETVQAIIILSLWTPICGLSQSGGKDEKALISIAVRMALNMRLQESSALAKGLRDSTLISTPQANYDVELNRARLWIVLANTESMLCLGSGRKTLSRRSQADIDLIPITSPTTISDGRDLRIRLLAEIFNTTDSVMAVTLTHRGEIESWYETISSTLAAMDRLSRLILPLSVVHDHDKFYYHMLFTILLSCRHLVLYNAIFHSRRVVLDSNKSNPFWFMEIRPHGLNVIVTWAKEELQVAEAILVSILQTEYSLLATSPDLIFTMVGFASGIVLGVKFLIVNRVGIDVLGSGDKLLEQAVVALSHASFSDDHAARRTAQLVRIMITAWQNSRQTSSPGTPPAVSQSLPLPFTTNSYASSSQYSHHAHPHGVIPDLAFPLGLDISLGDPPANSEQSQDQDFWATFFENDTFRASTFGTM